MDLSIQEIVESQISVNGDVGEMKYQMNHMLDVMATTPGARFYSTMCVYDPNTCTMQVVGCSIVTPTTIAPATPATGFMHGHSLRFETQTESHLAYDTVVDAMAGFCVEALTAINHDVTIGYGELKRDLFSLREPVENDPNYPYR